VATRTKRKPGSQKAASKKRPPPRPPKPARARSRGPALPAVDGDAPLHELTRDELSVFLYAALLPEETLRIIREMRLSVPGFRTEGLSEAERCDLIADELLAAPEARARILDALRNGFGRPPLVALGLDERAARDLLDVGTTEHGTVLALWRVLADPVPAVRALAKPLLARMVEDYYGPLPTDGAAPSDERQDDGADDKARLAALERERDRAREQVERTREQGEARAEKLQGQLKEARGAEARAASDAARAREAAEQARDALKQADEALAAVRGTDAAIELQRARHAARELEDRLGGSEASGNRLEARVGELERELDAARRKAEGSQPAAQPQPRTEPEEPEEAPASWLFPVYTREFYDSLEGWERRIQRAAFKQANLLAQDHRHPSLRALPLEGLPGYYRVRVATDVRLIYRRGEQGGAVEILSLIDREDLDRYVRQAKTRD
jgi:hypothetical protein